PYHGAGSFAPPALGTADMLRGSRLPRSRSVLLPDTEAGEDLVEDGFADLLAGDLADGEESVAHVHRNQVQRDLSVQRGAGLPDALQGAGEGLLLAQRHQRRRGPFGGSG